MDVKKLFEAFKNKSVNPSAPEIVTEYAEKQSDKPPKREEIVDFSFNECRFGHYAEGGFFKSTPVAAGLFGFFEFVTEDIPEEEYLMWRDSGTHPEKYRVIAKKGAKGFCSYSIEEKLPEDKE